MFEEIDGNSGISRKEKTQAKIDFVKKMMAVQMKKGFVNSKKFFEQFGIDRNNLNNYLEKIQRSDPEFYNEYCTVMNNHFANFKQNTKENILMMAKLANDGIELYDGTVREFDLLDCYEIIGRTFEGFSKAIIVPIFEEVERENRYDLQYNFGTTRKHISQAFDLNKSTYKINPLYIIADDFHDLTIEEKQYIINYFFNNNIPFTTVTFYYAVDRLNLAKKGNKKNNYFKILTKEENENRENA